MGDFAVTICKEMEAVGRVLVKIPAAETGKVDEITSLQNDLVGGSAPTGTCQRILTIQVVVQVLIKTKDASLELGATSCTGKVHIAPTAAIDIFVGIDDELEGSGFIATVAVLIVFVITQTVFVQVNGC